MANHGTRVRRYIDRYGVEKVEGFIDKVLSIDNLIDRHAPYIKRRNENHEKLERDARLVGEAIERSGKEQQKESLELRKLINHMIIAERKIIKENK